MIKKDLIRNELRKSLRINKKLDQNPFNKKNHSQNLYNKKAYLKHNNLKNRRLISK